ncbi:hypothetical protein CYY_008469 [Polysphondylium violaceum]|uniref:Uncharacterized protein n=1 Tax=Polysphondylium violaceum TaxID=133409 RepID=A0A8J4PN53_9MYCE|nr:hypothetical protein CYY_008469 [Polysphondylium violaceum]
MIMKCLSTLAPGNNVASHSSISMGSGGVSASGFNQTAMPGSAMGAYKYIVTPDGQRHLVLYDPVSGRIYSYIN